MSKIIINKLSIASVVLSTAVSMLISMPASAAVSSTYIAQAPSLIDRIIQPIVNALQPSVPVAPQQSTPPQQVTPELPNIVPSVTPSLTTTAPSTPQNPLLAQAEQPFQPSNSETSNVLAAATITTDGVDENDRAQFINTAGAVSAIPRVPVSYDTRPLLSDDQAQYTFIAASGALVVGMSMSFLGTLPSRQRAYSLLVNDRSRLSL